jgi:signal transduction histidine kinase/predicted metal-dependent hydrolase
MDATSPTREALTQFMRRTHRGHMLVRVGSIFLIAAGWVFAAGAHETPVALAWLAAALLAEWVILIRVRTFELALADSSATAEARVMRELTFLTGFLTAMFACPAVVLSTKGGAASVAALVISCGILMNIAAQHVLHRRMALVSLPTPALALALATFQLCGPGNEGIAASFAAIMLLHTYTLNAAAVRSYESLIDARLVAEQAGRAKSQFLANMSHELRTPLNAIIGYSELMRDSAIDDQRATDKEDHDRVISAAHRLKKLIDEVLDLSKVDAGGMTLEIASFDAAACLREAVEVITPIATAKGNALRLQIAPEVGLLQGDALRLGQCVLNLLSNAAKFTANGEISLSADVGRLPCGAPALVIKVADSGIGMTARQIDDIFEPFRQADSSITRRFGGTGLGLALTRQLARLMGGDLTVESEMGAGSCFTLSVSMNATLETQPAVADVAIFGGEEIRVRNLDFHWEIPSAGAPSMDRAFHLALSAVFPDGERFFVQSVRRFESLAEGKLAQDVRDFVRQESIHAREHLAFNKLHEAAGVPLDALTARAAAQLSAIRRRSPIAQLATTVSLEHFTAVFAMHLLKEPAHLAYATPAERALWRWHAVEEIEHKSVAFDLYQRATAHWPAAARWAHRSISFVDATARLLWVVWGNTGDICRTATGGEVKWRSRLLAHALGAPGVVRNMGADLLRFLGFGFHPRSIDDARWLAHGRSHLDGAGADLHARAA